MVILSESTLPFHFSSKVPIFDPSAEFLPSDFFPVTKEKFLKELEKPKKRIINRMECGVGVAISNGTCCHEVVGKIARDLYTCVPKSVKNYQELTLALSRIVEKYAVLCMIEAMTDEQLQQCIVREFVTINPDLGQIFLEDS